MDDYTTKFKEIIEFIITNKTIIIAVLLGGGILMKLLRGAKRILGAVVTVMALVAALSFFGIPIEPFEDHFNKGVSKFEQFYSWLQETVPEYWDKLAEGKDNNSGKDTVDTVNTVSPLGDSNPSDEDAAYVHFLDVGQADCIFIQDGDDTLLIDCGNYADAATVSQYLDGLGITQIDYFITTHPHEDHIGCAATVLRLYDVDTLIKTTATATSSCYKKMMEQADESGTEIENPELGEIYELGDGYFQIIGPVSYDSSEMNNNSIVVRYQYGNKYFLFCGDAEREEELEILDTGYDVSADVLKVGHHGSSSSTSYPWLRAIMPTYAIISVGTDNDYGHPSDDALSKLRDAGCEIYRTDQNSTIVIKVNDGELTPYCNFA